MSTKFVDASVLDLARATQFLHHIKPSLQNKLVFGIEKALPFDQSVVFHLTERNKDREERENSIFMLSAEYILEHPYWEGILSD